MLFNLKRVGVNFLMIFTLNLTANATAIIVKNQSDFDQLASTVCEQLKRSRNVEVQIRKGVYYYSDNHLLLKDVYKPELSVKIRGKGAVLVSKAAGGGEISPYNAVIRFQHDLDLWSDIFYSPEKVSIVDANKKLCRIKRNESLNVKEGGYILLTKWYTSGLYRIEKVEHDYIYFTAHNTWYRENYGEYDVNFDYVYNKSFPRYKLMMTDKVAYDCYVCSSSSFLTVQNSHFEKIEINGLAFVGGSGQEAVIMLDGLKANTVKLTNCSFSALRNNAISANSTDNVTIAHCNFTDCYSTVVTSDDDCANLAVKNCEWRECGHLLENPSCVIASGVNYVIKNNLFVDFYGRALTLGVYFSKGNSVHSSGAVENNEFYYTHSFFDKAPNNLLMDNGAIYVNTINDHLEISNNYIHDFVGACDNRGIFLDDGAKNVKISGNVITNVPNCAAISSRRVKSVESTVGVTNVGNLIQGNILEGTIRFEGNEVSGNGCEYGNNFFLVKANSEAPQNTLNNVGFVGEDTVLTFIGNEKGKIGIDSCSYKQLRKSPAWNQLKKVFVRLNK